MMRGLQQVVCRGAIDSDFLRSLMRAPTEALRGFELTPDESAMLIALQPQSLDDLAGGVEAWRRGDLVPARVRPLAWHAMPAALAG
jgi:hypothetical protein